MKNYFLSKLQILELVAKEKKRLDSNILLGKEQKDLLAKTADVFGFQIIENKLKDIFQITKQEKKAKNYGAIIQIKGNYTIPDFVVIQTEIGVAKIDLYIYHYSHTNNSNRLMAKKVMENKAVEFVFDGDEEYLYEALSDTSDQQYYEKIKTLAPGLPIYSVVFKEDGRYDVEEIGKVI